MIRGKCTAVWVDFFVRAVVGEKLKIDQGVEAWRCRHSARVHGSGVEPTPAGEISHRHSQNAIWINVSWLWPVLTRESGPAINNEKCTTGSRRSWGRLIFQSFSLTLQLLVFLASVSSRPAGLSCLGEREQLFWLCCVSLNLAGPED